MTTIRAATRFERHGGFPLSIMRIRDHSATAGLHGHDFCELVVVLSGKGRHKTDTSHFGLTAGDTFLLRGKMVHGYENTRDLSLINVMFDPDALRMDLAGLHDSPGYHTLFHIEPKLREVNRFAGRLQLSEDQLAHVVEIIARIEEELGERRGGYQFVATGYLMQLIGYLSRCYDGMELPATRPLVRLGDVLSFIEEHYNETITVARLSKIARMSETSLIRTFNKVLGRPPMEHVIRTRVSKAKELLRQDDLRITEIAFACGFNDSNYFSRQFRKVTGQSPRTFRRAE